MVSCLPQIWQFALTWHIKRILHRNDMMICVSVKFESTLLLHVVTAYSHFMSDDIVDEMKPISNSKQVP